MDVKNLVVARRAIVELKARLQQHVFTTVPRKHIATGAVVITPTAAKDCQSTVVTSVTIMAHHDIRAGCLGYSMRKAEC